MTTTTPQPTDRRYKDQLAARRQLYWATKGQQVPQRTVPTITVARSFAIRRKLIDGRTILTLSTKEIAALMDVHYITVVRWQAAGLFPRAIYPTHRRVDHCVYSLTQALALAKIYANHVNQNHSYLYQTDVDTVSALEKVMKSIG